MNFSKKILLAGLVSTALAACGDGPSQRSSSGDANALRGETPAMREPDLGSSKRVRLLSEDQYLNTLANIFGDDIRLETNFAPISRADGLLQVGASAASVNSAQVEQYQRIAATIAGRIFDREYRQFYAPCEPRDVKSADAACARKYLATLGRLIYRKQLAEPVLNDAVAQASASADRLKDFYVGLSIAFEGMLISPQVLFVAEQSEPDPRHPGRERLDAYSLASRLSLFLWNSAPDDAVLKAAESGEIQTDKGRTRLVEMMIASPRLEQGVRAFFDDMLGFDRFSTLAKDPAVYPSFTGVTAHDAREQTLRTIVDHLLAKKGDYRDLYTTRHTFISPALAALYQTPATQWMPYEVPQDSHRAGLLTQISFLALHSHPGRSSPTLRGKALRELLLCQIVPDPPPNVDFSALENPDPNIKTQRQRVAQHLENPVCAGCHRITDPIGLSLENFDGSGQYRDTEKGAAIDASGSLDGKSFSDAIGLGQALRDHPALTSCLVQRMYSYGVGSPMTKGERPMATYFNEIFAKQQYRVPDLMKAIALSQSFASISPSPSAAAQTASASPESR